MSGGLNHAQRVRFFCIEKNPYAAQLKRPAMIRLVQDSIVDFKSMSAEQAFRARSLINLYLKECAASRKRLNLS